MFKDFRIRFLQLDLVAVFAFIAGGIIGFTFYTGTANAHPGGMAADGCHKSTATGARHAHVNIPDGPRVDVDCEAWKAITEGKSAPADRAQVKILAARIVTLLQSLDAYRVRALKSEAKNAGVWAQAKEVEFKYKGMMAAAHKDRKAAKTLLAEAKVEADAIVQVSEVIISRAESRERGAGPPANLDCQRTLRLHVIDRSVSWITNDVGVDEEDRNAIKRDCLGE